MAGQGDLAAGRRDARERADVRADGRPARGDPVPLRRPGRRSKTVSGVKGVVQQPDRAGSTRRDPSMPPAGSCPTNPGATRSSSTSRRRSTGVPPRSNDSTRTLGPIVAHARAAVTAAEGCAWTPVAIGTAGYVDARVAGRGLYWFMDREAGTQSCKTSRAMSSSADQGRRGALCAADARWSCRSPQVANLSPRRAGLDIRIRQRPERCSCSTPASERFFGGGGGGGGGGGSCFPLPVAVVTALAGSTPAMATPLPTAAGATPTVGAAGATTQGSSCATAASAIPFAIWAVDGGVHAGARDEQLAGRGDLGAAPGKLRRRRLDARAERVEVGRVGHVHQVSHRSPAGDARGTRASRRRRAP